MIELILSLPAVEVSIKRPISQSAMGVPRGAFIGRIAVWVKRNEAQKLFISKCECADFLTQTKRAYFCTVWCIQMFNYSQWNPLWR